jgi:hypothetical protein
VDNQKKNLDGVGFVTADLMMADLKMADLKMADLSSREKIVENIAEIGEALVVDLKAFDRLVVFEEVGGVNDNDDEADKMCCLRE